MREWEKLMKNNTLIEKARVGLDVKFQSDDLGEITFREYFHKLLQTLWYEDEGFSSKRPFGNSGWSWDLVRGLVANGLVAGGVGDSYDGIVEATDLIQTMISVMCGVEPE